MSPWAIIGVVLATFIAMEGVAWSTHKFIMHGILWSVHRDHHSGEHKGPFERNDGFLLMQNDVQALRQAPSGQKPFEFKRTNGFMITFDITSKDTPPKH